jgi:hypothetical protein
MSDTPLPPPPSAVPEENPRTGRAPRYKVQEEDEAVINEYLDRGDFKPPTQEVYKTTLRALAEWTREEPNNSEAPKRPTLRTILEREDDPKDDDDLKGFLSEKARDNTTAKNIAATVNAARTGKSARPHLKVHEDDEAVINEFLDRGDFQPLTGQVYKSTLRALAVWTRENLDDPEAPKRPALRTILEREDDPKDDDDLKAFTMSDETTAKYIAATVNAVRTGHTTRQHVHKEDEAVINFALRHATISVGTKQNYKSLLRALAVWTRENLDDPEAPKRPALRTLLERGGDAMLDTDVLAFKTSQQAKSITAAVNAARNGYVITLWQKQAQLSDEFMSGYARDLFAMGQWMVKIQRGTLRHVAEAQEPAGDDKDVIDFRKAHPNQYPNIVLAIDLLRSGQKHQTMQNPESWLETFTSELMG